MTRKHSRRPRSEQPTRDSLVAAVVDLLETTPVGQISIEAVLEVSKVSRSSLYYHFTDLPDLLEEALVARFARSVDESIAAMQMTLQTAGSSEEVAAALRALTRVTQSRARAGRRIERIATLAECAHSPQLRERLAAEQRRMNEATTRIIRSAQERGWVRSDLEPQAVAVLIQAYTIGRIVDDIDPEPVDEEAWFTVIDEVVATVLTPPAQ